MNEASRDVTVLLGNGYCTFGNRADYVVGGMGSFVSQGDFRFWVTAHQQSALEACARGCGPLGVVVYAAPAFSTLADGRSSASAACPTVRPAGDLAEIKIKRKLAGICMHADPLDRGY